MSWKLCLTSTQVSALMRSPKPRPKWRIHLYQNSQVNRLRSTVKMNQSMTIWTACMRSCKKKLPWKKRNTNLKNRAKPRLSRRSHRLLQKRLSHKIYSKTCSENWSVHCTLIESKTPRSELEKRLWCNRSTKPMQTTSCWHSWSCSLKLNKSIKSISKI